MASRNTIEIVINADGSQAIRVLGQTSTAAGNMSKQTASSMQSLSSSTMNLVQSFIGPISLVGGLTLAAGAMKASIELAKEQIRVEKQLDTVLRSTGGAAGLSADEIKTMASSLQDVTNFGDEATIAGQNLLLTFTNIGRDIFPSATKTMLDMSSALNQDLKSSAIQLGKALNDPIQGVSALQRVGVSFSTEQETMIKSLVETGHLVQAQTLILDELQKEFGGSAEAARQADGGIQAAKNAFGDLGEVIGAKTLPAVEKFNNFFITSVKGWTSAIQDMDKINNLQDAGLKRLGVTYSQYLSKLRSGELTQEDLRQAMAEANREIELSKIATERANAAVKYYTQEQQAAAQAAADAHEISIEALEQEEEGYRRLIELISGMSEKAVNAQSARLTGMADAYNRMYGAGTADFTRTTPDQAIEAQTTKEESMKEAGEKAADAFSSSFSTAFDSIGSMIEQQLQPTLQEVFQLDTDTARVDEDARRLATVVTEGFGSEWLSGLAEKFGGESFFQPIITAMESSDEGALKAAASGLLNDAISRSQLIDKELIKQRVKQQLIEQQVKQDLIDQVRAELAAEGVISGAVAQGMKEDEKNWAGTGKNIVQGIDKGIKDNEAVVYETVKAMAKRAYEEAATELGIKSPSTKFEVIGIDSARGFIVGMDQMQPKVSQAISNLITLPLDKASMAGFNQVMADAEDVLEHYLESKVSRPKEYLIRRRYKDVLRANLSAIVDPITGELDEAMAKSLLKTQFIKPEQKLGFSRAVAVEGADIFVEAFNKELEEQRFLDFTNLMEGVNVAGQFTSFAQSVVQQMAGESKALQDFILSGEKTMDFHGQIIDQVQATQLLNSKLKEQISLKDEILGLQQQQDVISSLQNQRQQVELTRAAEAAGLNVGGNLSANDMAFLQQQLSLINSIRQMGGDAGTILGGAQLGIGTSLTDLLRASSAVPGVLLPQILSGLNSNTYYQNFFNQTVNTAATSSTVVQDFATMQALLGT